MVNRLRDRTHPHPPHQKPTSTSAFICVHLWISVVKKPLTANTQIRHFVKMLFREDVSEWKKLVDREGKKRIILVRRFR
ncbi:MAG: hypothetical protein U7127_06045 [Phormidium sp.]